MIDYYPDPKNNRENKIEKRRTVKKQNNPHKRKVGRKEGGRKADVGPNRLTMLGRGAAAPEEERQ